MGRSKRLVPEGAAARDCDGSMVLPAEKGGALPGGLAKRGSAIDLALETNSQGSSGTWTTCCENFPVETQEVDLLDSMLDDLSEKRGATRERALAQLTALFREDFKDEEAAANETLLISRCINGIRRGSNTEAVLSAQLLGLHVMSLPAPSENILLEAQPDLVRAAGFDHAPEVRVAAIEALALLAYVAAEDEGTTLRVMERCTGWWAKGDPRGRAAAVRAWSFLFTSLQSLLPTPVVEDLLVSLAALLHDGNVDVRNAAGEAVSLLYHCCGLQKVLESVEEEADVDDEEGHEDEGGESSAESTPHTVTSTSNGSGASNPLGDVVCRMRDLATGHRGDQLRRSRREKASLRTTFRGIIALLEGGHVPCTRIKLQHGDSLVVETLEGNVALSYLRRFLAGGFQVHLQRNPLLHDIFAFTPATVRPDRMSAMEKRHFRSPSSHGAKARTHERKGDRALKASRQAAALHGAE